MIQYGSAIVFAFVVGYMIGKYLQPVIKNHRLIKERRMKILHNPFNDTYMWTIFNPATRTWHWSHNATQREIESWLGVEDISLGDNNG